MKDSLIRVAKEYASRSYSPYSHFPVGAAVLCDDGSVFGGTNIENASYGLSMCAERCAMFSGAVQGYARRMVMLVVYAPTAGLTMPCGACRQVMAELLSSDAEIVVTNGVLSRSFRVGELLPGAFSLEI